jgi:formylglycine-generating enzyme
MAEKHKKDRREHGLRRSGHRGRTPSIAWAVIIGLSTLVLVSWTLHSRSADPSRALASTSVTPPAFQPTVTNAVAASKSAPNGMAWISGGEFSMGANDPPDMDDVGMKATLDARPIHRVYVDGFFMDRTDVTNAQFAEFVKATGYVTIAERTPTAEEFPGAPPANPVGIPLA